MNEYTVSYHLEKDQQDLLSEVTDIFNQNSSGVKFDEHRMFSMIMQAGCNYDITQKLKFYKKNISNNIAHGKL